jgi:hypothetical protein
MPDILAQKDFLLLADFEPFFNLLGLVVTAIDSLEPGFAALYDAIPFLFKPPDSDLPSFLCHAGVDDPPEDFKILALPQPLV